MKSKITWELPATAQLIGVCRNTLSTYLSGHAISQEDIDNLQIILGEACANVVRHAYTNPDKKYRIVLRHGPERVAMDIIDKGMGFDTSMPRERCETDEGCGVGLTLIRELSDCAQIVSIPGKGSSLHIEYVLHFQNDAPANSGAMRLPS